MAISGTRAATWANDSPDRPSSRDELDQCGPPPSKDGRKSGKMKAPVLVGRIGDASRGGRASIKREEESAVVMTSAPREAHSS